MLFLIYFSERVNADLSGLLPVTTSGGEPAMPLKEGQNSSLFEPFRASLEELAFRRTHCRAKRRQSEPGSNPRCR